MQCPRCKGTNFVENKYEVVKVDTCQDCHGIWLDEDEILCIVEEKDKKFSHDLVKTTVSHSFSGVPKEEHGNKMFCPKCGAHMVPINYAVSSGVIIDRCPNGHGLWFDKHELEKVQAYREYWSEEVAKKQNAFESILENAETKRDNELDKESKDNTLLFTIAKICVKISDRLF
jgi:Zn-finger nucleic acid-binding protein